SGIRAGGFWRGGDYSGLGAVSAFIAFAAIKRRRIKGKLPGNGENRRDFFRNPLDTAAQGGMMFASA
ncbi:MAG: hypothetical protein MPK62_03570, partial [Alphaproteobacteria bacterium]|nr:hypothetical protein [Alphaproteobacteria bacterium]MDA8030208.1 hypothetical protein [Alphaproteobacteria bacterium]